MPNPHKAWGRMREVASEAARTPHGRIKLSQCPSIRGALQRWCTAHARHDQQDGAEFYKHDLSSPVLLHMPMMSWTDGQNVPLQSLVLQWHEDHQWMQALTEAHPIVCLQLSRGVAADVKDLNPVTMPTSCVHMPVFAGPALSVSWIPYTIRAVVLHHGSACGGGHFRAVLYQGVTQWVADDEVKPVPAGLSAHELAVNVYMIWITRSQKSHEATNLRPQRGSSGSGESNNDRQYGLGNILLKYF